MANKYVQYKFNRARFEEFLDEQGYKNHLDFCRKGGVHKNTLNYYLSGRDVFSKKLYEIAAILNADPRELIEPIQSKIQNIEEIESIVRELASQRGVAVILLGSRADGSAKKYSDWDLGVTRAEIPINDREFLRMKGRVGELADNLPRKVDLVNLDAAPYWFLHLINYSVIFLGGDSNSFHHFRGVLDGIKKYKTQKVA